MRDVEAPKAGPGQVVLDVAAAGGSLFITRPTLSNYVATRGDLFGWISRGELDVRIGGTYPLDNASRAHDDLGGRRTTGKLLLLPR